MRLLVSHACPQFHRGAYRPLRRFSMADLSSRTAKRSCTNTTSFLPDSAASRGSPRVVVLAGPTGVGKSALAEQLCATLPGGGEIVSADSVQVYKMLDIGSAKPTVEVRASILPADHLNLPLCSRHYTATCHGHTYPGVRGLRRSARRRGITSSTSPTPPQPTGIPPASFAGTPHRPSRTCGSGGKSQWSSAVP